MAIRKIGDPQSFKPNIGIVNSPSLCEFHVEESLPYF